MSQLNLTPEATRSDRCPGRQILKLRTIRHKRVSRIFALRNRTEIDSNGELKGNILHAMNGKIDPTVEECFVDFLGEKTLATDLGERHVENLVPSRADRNEVNCESRP